MITLGITALCHYAECRGTYLWGGGQFIWTLEHFASLGKVLALHIKGREGKTFAQQPGCHLINKIMKIFCSGISFNDDYCEVPHSRLSGLIGK